MTEKQSRQPRLISDTKKLYLKSPVFHARPGWGGQIASWFKGTPNTNGLMLLGMLVAVLISTRFIDRGLTGNTLPEIPLSNGQALSVSAIDIVIAPGTGIILAARQAVGQYLKSEGITLTAEQRIFTENYLNAHTSSSPISGQTVSFPIEELHTAVSRALTASPATLLKLSEYAKKAKF